MPGDPRLNKRDQDFYRLDVNQDGVLTGKERSRYSHIDTDSNKKITMSEWMGEGYDPGSDAARYQFEIGGENSGRRRTALEAAMPNYEKSVATGKPIKDYRGRTVFDGKPESLQRKYEELSALKNYEIGRAHV